jgi:hypothetical protein
MFGWMEEGYMYRNFYCGESVVMSSVCCWPTAWSGVLLEKLTVCHLVKKLPAFDGTRILITVFTKARYFYVSWDRWIQSTSSHCIYKMDLGIILPSVFKSSKSPLSFRFPHQNSVCISFLSLTCHMPFPSLLLVWSPQCSGVQIVMDLIMYFSPSLLGTNILLLTKAKMSLGWLC